MKIKNLYLGLMGQMPLKRFVRNMFITRNGWGLFSKRSHFREDGTPKVKYNRIETAAKAAEGLSEKNGVHFSYYKCIYCDGYHLGKNRDNKYKNEQIGVTINGVDKIIEVIEYVYDNQFKNSITMEEINKENIKGGCPCLYLDKPCDEQCTCIHPYSSFGCRNCCTYGNIEQRKKQAEILNNYRLNNNKEIVLKNRNEKGEYEVYIDSVKQDRNMLAFTENEVEKLFDFDVDKASD